ncbi:MAG: (2Fe-2S)-binding protein [Planctomycetes bacterium]|nr:(2Fe-2S)-binding protein [Planctomycetota bacterium]
MASFRLTLNGETRTVDAEPDTPLLWVLRDPLGLTGTKYGCGVGVCGACFVLQDGRAVRSCQVPVSDATRGAWTTIEGLSKRRDRPLQVAWLAEDVAQCGYCQPAMILRAAALLNEHPQPTDTDMDAAMVDVVCRCGTYQRIRRAIRAAAATRAKR